MSNGEKLLNDVAEVFGVKATEIVSKEKGKLAVCNARGAYVLFLAGSGKSNYEIEKAIGRTRTGVLHLISQHRTRLAIEKKFAFACELIKQRGHKL